MKFPLGKRRIVKKVKLLGKMMVLYCYLIAYCSGGWWDILLAHKAKSWARGTPSRLAGQRGALPREPHPKATSRALELGSKPKCIFWPWPWTTKLSADVTQSSSLLFGKGISFEHPKWSLKLKFTLLSCGNVSLPVLRLCCSPPRPQAAVDNQHCQVIMTLFFHKSPLSALILLPLANLVFFCAASFPSDHLLCLTWSVFICAKCSVSSHMLLKLIYFITFFLLPLSRHALFPAPGVKRFITGWSVVAPWWLSTSSCLIISSF